MTDIILEKRNGAALTGEQLRFVVDGFTKGDIPDYQMSALLMAIWFRGMNEEETALLTQYMADSGDTIDLSSVPGIKVDKHSTGGVGDKTTLVVCPIAAACGIPVAKMSGRGLGHTGGTIDKLESIPGFQTTLSQEEFFRIVRDTGLAVIGQSGDIAPADKKIYALRDVTGTVDNRSLIASSIMSKKLAAGADAILLDVKTGSGAFLKTPEESAALAEAMVKIGEQNGRRTAALITDMDRPLGYAIGNALEIEEAVQTLRGNGPADLTALCLELAANMLVLADKGELADCRKQAEEALQNGRAFEKLCAMVEAQGGDASTLWDLQKLPKTAFIHEVRAPADGWIHRMQTEQIGHASALLGAGRFRKEDRIDYGAGIRLRRKTGEFVRQGDLLAEFFASREELFAEAEAVFQTAVEIRPEKPAERPLLYARVTKEGIVKY